MKYITFMIAILMAIYPGFTLLFLLGMANWVLLIPLLLVWVFALYNYGLKGLIAVPIMWLMFWLVAREMAYLLDDTDWRIMLPFNVLVWYVAPKLKRKKTLPEE